MAKRLTYYVEVKHLDKKEPRLIFTSKSMEACKAVVELIAPGIRPGMVIISQGTSWRYSAMVSIYRHKQRNITFKNPVKWRRENA